MADGETDERAACVRVGVGRPFAHEVRREQQPLAAGRPLRSLCFEVGEVAVENAAEPGGRAGRAQHHTHRLPRVGDGVAERMQPPSAIVLVGGERREDDA